MVPRLSLTAFEIRIQTKVLLKFTSVILPALVENKTMEGGKNNNANCGFKCLPFMRLRKKPWKMSQVIALCFSGPYADRLSLLSKCSNLP